ncbi:MAG: succinic semialdehyde dehydrogenase [Corynebacterium sp.]|nr:succinic semialdehyde dehydrogenase [Corynebacterium sp.]
MTATLNAELTPHSAEETAAAFETARRAQKEWARTPLKQRKAIFLRYHDLVLEHQEELLDVIQDENGKNRASAFEEIMDAAITARHYAYQVERLLRARKDIFGGALPLITHTIVEHPPKGVVGVIAPWNYPLVLALSDAVAALLAGNAVVLKPDSLTPRTAFLAASLLYEAGLPRDLLQIVPGKGSVVGQEIMKQADYIMFTGSSATGATLAAQAGERLVGISAELGGKNPMIICHDADVTTATYGALNACFSNSGQLCISIERIYVHEAVADEFISQFVDNVKAMRVAGGHDWTVDMGSLISEEHLATVDSFVRDAVAKGATVLAGGTPLPELGPKFYAPTVLTDVPETADLYRQEIFGPVVYIETVSSEEEAVAKANDSSYGLNSSVWGSPSTALSVAKQLETGTVNINEGYAAGWGSMRASMGGWKRSGIGRRHGDDGLLKYTEPRTIAAQYVMPISGFRQMSKETYAKVMTAALKWAKPLLR